MRPRESAILNRFVPEVGSALVLGCGGGREAIALAKCGWQVAGIDNVPSLIDAAKVNASQADVRIDWHCYDVTQGIPADGAFDLVCLLGQLYSLIPTRTGRVCLLAACRQRLKPNGACVLNFIPGDPPSPRERRAQRWRKGFAWLVGGNRDCQLGDRLVQGHLFVHRFSTVAEIAEEAAAAGLSLTEAGDGSPTAIMILRPIPDGGGLVRRENCRP